MTPACARCAAALLAAPVAATAAPAMSYLRTYGPAGDPATRLGKGLGIVSIVVIVIIAVLLAGGDLPPARAARDPRELAVARDEGGMLLDLHRRRRLDRGADRLRGVDDVHGRRGGDARQRRRPDPAGHRLAVVVERALPRPGSGADVHVANEIHIPVGRPVRLELEQHRRDPFVLDSPARRQDGRHSGPDQRDVAAGRPRRRLSRAVRRILRRPACPHGDGRRRRSARRTSSPGASASAPKRLRPRRRRGARRAGLRRAAAARAIACAAPTPAASSGPISRT